MSKSRFLGLGDTLDLPIQSLEVGLEWVEKLVEVLTSLTSVFWSHVSHHTTYLSVQEGVMLQPMCSMCVCHGAAWYEVKFVGCSS